MLNMRLGRILATLAVAGLGVFGLSSPAHADGPTISYADICGAVQITVTGDASIRVSRDGTVIGSTTADVSYWGAGPGDLITVDDFDESHTYNNPEGCAFPSIEFDVSLDCQTLVTLHVKNSGTEPVDGFAWETNDGSEDLDPFPAGESTQQLDADGPFALVKPRDGGEIVWLSGVYEQPRTCSPDSVEVKFTDSCGKVKVDITSEIKPTQGALVAKNGTLVDIAFFSASSPFSKSYDANPGDKFEVYYPVPGDDPQEELTLKAGAVVDPSSEGFVKLGEHVHTPPSCGDLPVTGLKIGTAVLGGMLLIGAGVTLYVASRRRRVVSA